MSVSNKNIRRQSSCHEASPNPHSSIDRSSFNRTDSPVAVPAKSVSRSSCHQSPESSTHGLPHHQIFRSMSHARKGLSANTHALGPGNQKVTSRFQRSPSESLQESGQEVMDKRFNRSSSMQQKKHTLFAQTARGSLLSTRASSQSQDIRSRSITTQSSVESMASHQRRATVTQRHRSVSPVAPAGDDSPACDILRSISCEEQYISETAPILSSVASDDSTKSEKCRFNLKGADCLPEARRSMSVPDLCKAAVESHLEDLKRASHLDEQIEYVPTPHRDEFRLVRPLSMSAVRANAAKKHHTLKSCRLPAEAFPTSIPAPKAQSKKGFGSKKGPNRKSKKVQRTFCGDLQEWLCCCFWSKDNKDSVTAKKPAQEHDSLYTGTSHVNYSSGGYYNEAV